jgi:hypothetical protein
VACLHGVRPLAFGSVSATNYGSVVIQVPGNCANITRAIVPTTGYICCPQCDNPIPETVTLADADRSFGITIGSLEPTLEPVTTTVIQNVATCVTGTGTANLFYSLTCDGLSISWSVTRCGGNGYTCANDGSCTGTTFLAGAQVPLTLVSCDPYSYTGTYPATGTGSDGNTYTCPVSGDLTITG